MTAITRLLTAKGRPTKNADKAAVAEFLHLTPQGELVLMFMLLQDIKVPNAEAATLTKAVAGLDALGRTDWRVWTAEEADTCKDCSRFDPAADPRLRLRSGWYWTSTRAAFSPSDYARCVYFGNGNSYYSRQDDDGFVRAVCVSQSLAIGSLP